jgi:hypothetical protein
MSILINTSTTPICSDRYEGLSIEELLSDDDLIANESDVMIYIVTCCLCDPINNFHFLENDNLTGSKHIVGYLSNRLVKCKKRFKRIIFDWDYTELKRLKSMIEIVSERMLGEDDDMINNFFKIDFQKIGDDIRNILISKCWLLEDDPLYDDINHECEKLIYKISLIAPIEGTYGHLSLTPTLTIEPIDDDKGGCGRHWNRAHWEIVETLQFMKNNSYMSQTFPNLVEEMYTTTYRFALMLDDLDKSIDDKRFEKSIHIDQILTNSLKYNNDGLYIPE